MVVQFLDTRLVVSDSVESLVDGFKAGLIERLEPDKETVATAPDRQV